MTTRRIVMLPLLVLGMLGCGGGSAKTVEVTGTVTFEGTPVEKGLIIFQGEDGRSASGSLEAGGKFKVSGAPAGKVSIGVNTKAALGAAQLDAAQTKGRVAFVDVPARYLQPSGSGLSETLPAKSPLELKLTR